MQDLVSDLEKRLAQDLNIYPNVPATRRHQERNLEEDELVLKLLMCGAFYPHYFVSKKSECSSSLNPQGAL